jgi:hypothetical protein
MPPLSPKDLAMLTLLGSLLGFSSSFLPQILELFKSKQEHKNKIELMRVQGEIAAAGAQQQVNLLEKQAEIEEAKGLYTHDAGLDVEPGGFIAALRASVRPVLTYAFFAMFMATKAVIGYKVLTSGGEWTQAITLMWDEETAGLFAAIMSFWFGNRAVTKMTGRTQ